MSIEGAFCAIGALIVILLLAFAFVVDDSTILPYDPTKDEWRSH